MAKAFEDDLIKQGVPLFVVHIGQDKSTQRVESYNLDTTVDGMREQNIDIYYRFIGKIE